MLQDNYVFISLAPAVCKRLLGEPSSMSSREWRWRSKGSFRLNLDTGMWNDFEAGDAGGVIALVMREERVDKPGALTWLKQQGFLLPHRAGRSELTDYGNLSVSSVVRKSPYSPVNQATSKIVDASAKDTLRWIRRQILPIRDSPDHPVRAWMRQRNLWRPELPLPPSLRWISSDAPAFRGTHSGVGAIAFPLAPIAAWRASYPKTPAPTAVQLVCIDVDGRRADYENKQSRRVDKPKFGAARMAVWTIGDVSRDRVIVCEGAADALALAARDADPVIATLTIPSPAIRWHDALSVFDFVTLWPDMDVENKYGRRPGLDAGISLAQARKLAEQFIDVIGVDIGKDAADAARATPLGDIDFDELVKFAVELQSEGMTEFEALRYASTLIK